MQILIDHYRKLISKLIQPNEIIMKNTKQRKIISDKLVTEKTGKTMEEWFKLLDKKGAKKMKHADIFDLVSRMEGLKPMGRWNQNLLTTTYEWDRSLKERGQKEEGFEVSISKTISVHVNVLYSAWIDDKVRTKWLSEKRMSIRKSTENKSLVIKWFDETTVRVELYKKGSDKTQAVVQQMKIQDSKTAVKMKDFWSKSLEKLKSILEKEKSL